MHNNQSVGHATIYIGREGMERDWEMQCGERRQREKKEQSYDLRLDDLRRNDQRPEDRLRSQDYHWWDKMKTRIGVSWSRYSKL